MRQRIHQGIFFISSLFLAFFLPVFPKFLPPIIAVLTINWIISGIYLTTIPKIFTEKWRLLTLFFATLYLVYLAGMLYTTDFTYGWFDLQVKLSLFIFPVIFATSSHPVFNKRQVQFIFGAFITGCIIGSLILLGHSLLVNERWGVPDPFYYTHLTWYFHASYLAMYNTFAIGIVLYHLPVIFARQSAYKTISLSLVVVYLQAFIFLLSSKAGLITLAFTEILFVVLLIVKKAGIPRIVFISVIMITLFALFSQLFPYAFGRVSKADAMVARSETLQKNPNDGTVQRKEIWKVSMGLVGKHFLFGTGTGDVKDVLMEAYQQHGLYPVYQKKLNAHNQYIQTFLALGIPGIGMLLLSLMIPAYGSFREKKYLYLLFLLIFAFNILFESMFETQAGVIFYAFFNVFLFSAHLSPAGAGPGQGRIL